MPATARDASISVKTQIDVVGLITVAKLIEYRIDNDIETARKRLSHEDAKEPIAQDGVIRNISEFLINNERVRLSDEIQEKEQWKQYWYRTVARGLKALGVEESFFHRVTLPDLLSRIKSGSHGYFRRFLLLQEAILAPIFFQSEDAPTTPPERIHRESSTAMAALLGLPTTAANDIIDGAQGFFEYATDTESTVQTGTLIGIAACFGMLLISSVAIASAIGHLYGLAGAAATTKGLALLGGGAISAGGMGMVGSGITLAVAGVVASQGISISIASWLASQPKERIIVDQAKELNYLAFLAAAPPIYATDARKEIGAIVRQFVEFKHRAERELLLCEMSEKEFADARYAIQVMNIAYDQIALGLFDMLRPAPSPPSEPRKTESSPLAALLQGELTAEQKAHKELGEFSVPDI